MHEHTYVNRMESGQLKKKKEAREREREREKKNGRRGESSCSYVHSVTRGPLLDIVGASRKEYKLLRRC